MLYTRKGDEGLSSTISEQNISKADEIFELLGTLDEANAALSLAKALWADDGIADNISEIQREIIGLCEEIAGGRKFVTQQRISDVERLIDENYKGDAHITKLCCSDAPSAALNMARTIIRRGERCAVRLKDQGKTDTMTIKYLNRLSDLLYALMMSKN